ncbi:MAG TPA: phospholipase D-like domain-containing protein, partial [Mycobacteriales bacterium]|nr:phospholipase D-like domain-containing protein [Mycobacteriales bacterium]
MSATTSPTEDIVPPDPPGEASDAERVQQLRRRLEGLLGIPATEGNELTLLRNGDQIFPAMLEAVRASERTIDFLTFVYWKGDIAHEFAHALAERAQAGVRVRVLLDAVGGRLIDIDLIEHMSDCGVLVEWFRKPIWQGRLSSPFKQNHRTHRKVLICDEKTGFTGGVGIAEEWCGDARNEDEWRDTHVRVRGPAVDGLSAAFAQNWAETGHPLAEEPDTFPDHGHPGSSVVQVARGSASVGWNDMATVFRVMFESATDRVTLQTAYFAPDETFCELMLGAVRRGVDVDVLLPGPHADKRVCQLTSESIYECLVDGGVRIWAFQPSMMHAKIMTVDGLAAVLGSANMNRRSLSHDEEVVMSVFDPAVARELEADFWKDLERAELINPVRWADRPLRQKAKEKVGAALKHWM